VIVSQPSQPWTAGASHLFTQEFARLAKSRLAPGGVFVQWTSVGYLDAALLRSLTATLLATFGHVRLYNPQGGELVFVASDAPLPLEAGYARLPAALAAHCAGLGIAGAEDLLAGLVLDETAAAEFAASVRPNEDDRNLMATHSYVREDGLGIGDLYTELARMDPLARGGFWAALQATGTEVDALYLALRLAARGATRERLPAVARALPAAAARMEAVHLLATGAGPRARRALDASVAAAPADQPLRWLVLASQLDGLLDGSAPEHLQAYAAALDGVPAAVLAGRRHERAGDWARIEALEPVLAQASVRDPWFASAMALRVAWRLQAGTAREGRAAEALALIDRAARTRLDVPMLLQRGSAGERLADPAVVLESSVMVLELLRQNLARRAPGAPLPTAQRIQLRSAFGAVSDLLATHPGWRELRPRGPTAWALRDAVAAQLDAL
jgi:hypothetical protein